MSAFPKADVQNVRDGVELNGCSWPKADIRTQSESVLATGVPNPALNRTARKKAIMTGSNVDRGRSW